MSVLSRPRSLSRTHAVPTPRRASHDAGLGAPVGTGTAAPGSDRTSRRRRAALVLTALLLAVVAGIVFAVVQLTADDSAPAAPLAPATVDAPSGTVSETDVLRDEKLLRQQLNSDATRASDAARDAAAANR